MTTRDHAERPAYVAEYVLAPRQHIAHLPEATRAMSQRVFDAAESRGLDVSVAQRALGGAETDDAHFHLRVTITAVDVAQYRQAEELSAVAADVIRDAFASDLWTIEDLRIRTFDAYRLERLQARERSTGREGIMSERDLVDRVGLTPRMARLVHSNPDMRRYFKESDPRRMDGDGRDFGSDRLPPER